MTQPTTQDQLTDADETYVYRNGIWTTDKGFCVSTTRDYALTMKFYQKHGRAPFTPEPVKARPRRSSKAELAKTKVLRAAVARALAAKSSRPCKPNA